MLHVHETLFWVDSSVRMHTSNIEEVYQRVTSTSRGVLTFRGGQGINVFMSTHFGMYQYLPFTKTYALNVRSAGANTIFVHRSQEVDIFARFVVILIYVEKNQFKTNVSAVRSHM